MVKLTVRMIVMRIAVVNKFDGLDLLNEEYLQHWKMSFIFPSVI